eukprot:TRINITY_DN62787_c0_g1_i1.p2 TRINITY_DN62787_c0_g1~~TRINITY_DN62787_c0_g1_i1.p2  ORF type:complete len:129 (-),score=23.46 TRINITY_DN62787_c0_g1_i1:269-655(-)
MAMVWAHVLSCGPMAMMGVLILQGCYNSCELAKPDGSRTAMAIRIQGLHFTVAQGTLCCEETNSYFHEGYANWTKPNASLPSFDESKCSEAERTPQNEDPLTPAKYTAWLDRVVAAYVEKKKKNKRRD